VIVAGKNSGRVCREQAPLGLIGLGVRCIIATSFARTFFRMAVDPACTRLSALEAYRVAKEGDSRTSTPRWVWFDRQEEFGRRRPGFHPGDRRRRRDRSVDQV
jgi:hypothetical protein